MLATQNNPTRSIRRSVGILTAAEGLARPHWADHIANILSQVASPPVLTLLMAGLCAARLHEVDAWRWAALQAALTVALPIAFLVWLLTRGMVSDLDVRRREERTRPMLAALGGAAASLVVLRLGAAPQLLLGIGFAIFVQLLLVFFITLRWKISVHTTAAASFTVLMCSMAGAAAIPLAGLIPLVAWARIRLRRHTLAQTIAGTLWGGLSMAVVMAVGR